MNKHRDTIMNAEPMNARSATDQPLLKILNKLIEVCRNGHDGYMEAAGINSAAYKTMFAEYALQRSRFANHLANLVTERGGDPNDDGVHDAWTKIRPAVMGGDHGAIFDVCEHSEDAALNEYAKALDSDLPHEVREVVAEHYEQIVQAHDRIRNLRDAYYDRNKN